ncbi:hypothetical protein GCM10009592_33360 [Brachybacterium rhamnosum]|uniref:FHA domain-containing protein n=1 Tax=Brachybacterium rhamnosum TaxID=173361 RepID=A0ABW4Q4A5_9MICO|nr:hypothetical protein [Brachybacterium sp. SGAir0954]QCR53555.1 hypothetical protein C1N80_08145 [Brachybacterium sp. SGAir0954]
MTSSISVEFCGEWFTVADGEELTIGRDADLSVDDDNPFLHRRFLSIVQVDTLWWLVNIGSRLSATITDPGGAMQAWLAPGARIPLVFDETKVVFTAGPTTYDLSIHTESPSFERIAGPDDPVGETTVGAVQLTASQKLLILALSEQMLAREGSGMSTVPTSAQAAERLGWQLTKFNRKLDNVCDKLDRMGVRGLRGGPGKLASNRRARLVEHAVMSRLVTVEDLPLLDQAQQPDED